MIKYEFKEEDAYSFAHGIGIRAKVNGRELLFETCPYCHGGKNRDKWTFSINLDNGAHNCKRGTCDQKGNMLTLEQNFSWFSLGREFDEYYKPKKQFKRLPQPKEKIIPKPFAVSFMESRGISQETTEKYQITVRNDRQDVLCFPFYDENGVLQFIKYRNTDPESIKRFGKEYCEAECKPILFGMNLCNIENKTLVMTEGQIDSISLTEAGIENAVSVPTGVKGFTWIPYCCDWLNSFETLIVFGDYEKGHITLVDDMSRRFHGVVKHIKEEDYRDCKDANDILRKYGKEYLRSCVLGAIPVAVDHVKSGDDVEPINPKDIKKLETPFYTVNRVLHGGIPYGGLTIITSKSGVGKTPLALQFCVNALKYGKKIFIYSGEMSNGSTISTIQFQVAGSKNIQSIRNQYGDFESCIDTHTQKKIKDWYRGKIFVYDDSPHKVGEEKDIIKTIRKVVTRNEIEVVLIDNLMTAMTMYNSSVRNNELQKTTEFIEELVAIAKELNIVIILVAHKRKAGDKSDEDENDSISGSANIANLSAVTFSYNMPTSKDINDGEIKEEQRWLSIAKNRFFGTRISGDRKLVMSYCKESMRIYEEGVDDPNVDLLNDETQYIGSGFITTDADF